MRKLILTSASIIFMASVAHGGSFLTMDTAPSNDSSIELQSTQTIFELYGPSISDCVKVSCPSQEKLDLLARRGTTVMKVTGGDIEVVDNVFAPQKNNAKAATQKDEIAIISADEALEDEALEIVKAPEMTPTIAEATPEVLPDDFKTGPLPDGKIQADIAGVDTEFLPDLEIEFEPELATEMLSSIDDPAIVLEDVSSSSMEALTNAM